MSSSSVSPDHHVHAIEVSPCANAQRRRHAHVRAVSAWRALRLSSAVLASGLLLGACSEATAPEGSDRPPELTQLPRTLTAPEREAIRASNAFGLALLRETHARSSNSNVVLSPFSASVALGMAYAGAEGSTADSIRLVLGWSGADRARVLDGYRALPAMLAALDPQVQFTSANSLWVRNSFPLRSAFVGEMQDVFSAAVRNRAFDASTVSEINVWASDKTNGKIPQVIEEIPPGLVAILMNALYFKGSWRDRFDASKTVTMPFSLSTGSAISVPFMRRQGKILNGRALGASWVELPYGNGAFAMTLALPDNANDLSGWLNQLTATGMDSTLANLREGEVDLALPKLRLELGFQLKPVLEAMGMGIAFDPARADFSRLSAEPAFLSYVKQDVFLDVNEEGTEAAAVTQVGVSVTSAPLVTRVYLDRPFLLLIRERLSGTVLFAGLIEQP